LKYGTTTSVIQARDVMLSLQWFAVRQKEAMPVIQVAATTGEGTKQNERVPLLFDLFKRWP